jgi:maltose/maltodextrin transport system permease protein
MAMVQPRSTKYRVLASHLGMLGFIVIILFPLLMVISISFRSGNFAAGSLLPENPSLEHWYLALGIPYTGEDGTVTQPPFPVLLWLWNSIKIAVISSVMILALSTTSAYAFARMRFAGKGFLQCKRLQGGYRAF